MSLFKIKIWDKHEIQTFTEEGKSVIPHEDKLWHKFTFGLEVDRVKIDYFKEYVLFDEDNPIRCVKIFLSDDTGLFGRYTYDTFEKYYNDVYLPMIPKSLADYVNDLKGEPGED